MIGESCVPGTWMGGRDCFVCSLLKRTKHEERSEGIIEEGRGYEAMKKEKGRDEG